MPVNNEKATERLLLEAKLIVRLFEDMLDHNLMDCDAVRIELKALEEVISEAEKSKDRLLLEELIHRNENACDVFYGQLNFYAHALQRAVETL